MHKIRLKRMILHILRDKGPLHAYGIIKAFNEYTMGHYKPSTGALYPSIKSLLEDGLIEEVSSGGKKLYRLTDKGEIAISLDPPLHEYVKRYVGKGVPYKELWEIGRMIFSNWDSLDSEGRERIRSLLKEFEDKVREVVGGA